MLHDAISYIFCCDPLGIRSELFKGIGNNKQNLYSILVNTNIFQINHDMHYRERQKKKEKRKVEQSLQNLRQEIRRTLSYII